ncbi:ATP-binding cassette domain-containing protein, partial [Butyricicoccus sp. 1XD8-22]
MSNTHVFRVEQLVAGYDDKTILQGIDLEVPKNKISVIIGANGCGKSTLLKTMAK